AVFLREGGGGFVADEVFARARAVVAEGAADDLFYFAVVQVDAGAKLGHGRLGKRGAGGGKFFDRPTRREAGKNQPERMWSFLTPAQPGRARMRVRMVSRWWKSSLRTTEWLVSTRSCPRASICTGCE